MSYSVFIAEYNLEIVNDATKKWKLFHSKISATFATICARDWERQDGNDYKNVGIFEISF